MEYSEYLLCALIACSRAQCNVSELFTSLFNSWCGLSSWRSSWAWQLCRGPLGTVARGTRSASRARPSTSYARLPTRQRQNSNPTPRRRGAHAPTTHRHVGAHACPPRRGFNLRWAPLCSSPSPGRKARSSTWPVPLVPPARPLTFMRAQAHAQARANGRPNAPLVSTPSTPVSTPSTLPVSTRVPL